MITRQDLNLELKATIAFSYNAIALVETWPFWTYITRMETQLLTLATTMALGEPNTPGFDNLRGLRCSYGVLCSL